MESGRNSNIRIFVLWSSPPRAINAGAIRGAYARFCTRRERGDNIERQKERKKKKVHRRCKEGIDIGEGGGEAWENPIWNFTGHLHSLTARGCSLRTRDNSWEGSRCCFHLSVFRAWLSFTLGGGKRGEGGGDIRICDSRGSWPLLSMHAYASEISTCRVFESRETRWDDVNVK